MQIRLMQRDKSRFSSSRGHNAGFWIAIAILASCAPSASAQIADIVVTSSADYSPGLPCCGGAIASLFCTGLNVTGVVPAQGAPLPTTLAGVQVTVQGLPAPLIAVASLGGFQQINFQVPAQVYEGSTALVSVTQGGQSGTASVPFHAPSPGEFFELPGSPPASGFSYGIFQRVSDYSLITSQNPARSGDTLTGYLTGLLVPRPLPPDGTAALANPLSVVMLTGLLPDASTGPVYSVVFDSGAAQASALFIGLSPGSVGLGQVNFTVPALSPGIHILVLYWVDCTPPFMGGTPESCSTYISNVVSLPVGA